eukprot:9470594-Pyramimonas_sp.AAC.1
MKIPESEATPGKVSSFRTTNGQAQRFAARSRPDAARKQNLAALRVGELGLRSRTQSTSAS